MELINYVNIASQFIIAGGVFESIMLLIGHFIFWVFEKFEGGK